MNTCRACGTENQPGARFCASCGASLSLACPSCGAALPEDARFCPSCGTSIAAEVPPTHAEERRVVTLLFADLVDSTVLGERLDPERLRQVLDRYFAAMREEIEAEGGTVEKFIGDAIVAGFGTPVAHEDDAARALRAALRMRERLPSLNAELRETADVELRLRIGVNTGEVLATLDPEPGEPVFTGDAVNTAARFQSLADPGQVLAAERTIHAARGFRVKDLGPREMKGKAEPVRVFAVIEEDEHAELRGVPGLSAPMVGRDPEMALLASFLTRVRTERRPHLVTIYGEPGVGKSRLTQEFLRSAEDGGGRVVRGRCLPYGDGVTYWPLAEILKSVAGVLDTDPPEVALDRVRETGQALLGDGSDRSSAALAFTMGLDDPQVRLGDLDPKQVRQEIGAAWLAFFAALGRTGHLLAVIEDIHWADAALLDLLEELAERLETPVLFLCPARPELLAHRATWGGGKRNYSALALDPLTEQESEDLVRALLDIDDLPPSVHRQILERAGGNPFFLEEIVRQLVDGGLVVLDGGRWRATGEVAGVVIPDTVQAVLAARIDLLEPASRRLLQAASVVGRVFWPGAVERLVPEDAGGIEAAIAPLLERDLVRARPSSVFAGQDEYIFKHVLTRDVAYDTLPRRERASAHAAVAGWIEATVGERHGEFVELLAHHYVEAYRAGRESARSGLDLPPLRRRAFELTMAAADASRARFAVRRGVGYARQCLDLAEGPAERSLAAETLGHAHFAGNLGSDAWDAYVLAIDEELAAPERDPDRLANLVATAVALPTRWPGSMRTAPGVEEVTRCIEIGMADLPPGDSRARVQLQSIQASWPFAFPWLTFTEEDIDRLVRLGVEASEMALRLDLPDLASGALDAATAGLLAEARYLEATELEARRLPLLDRVHDPSERGDTYAMMAWCTSVTGHWRAALGYAQEGLDWSRTNVLNVTAHLLAWLVEARFNLGDWDGCLEGHRELSALLDFRRDDPPSFVMHGYACPALVHARRGERAEAEALDDALALAAAEDIGPTKAIRPWASQIPVLVELGRLDEAGRRVQDPIPGWKVHAPVVLAGEAAWIEATEAWDRAPEAFARMREFGGPRGCRTIVWRAALLEGRWLAATGRPEAAVRELQAARAGYVEGEMVYDVAVCDLEIASVLGLAALDPEARARLDEATSTFERLRSVGDLDRVRALA